MKEIIIELIGHVKFVCAMTMTGSYLHKENTLVHASNAHYIFELQPLSTVQTVPGFPFKIPIFLQPTFRIWSGKSVLMLHLQSPAEGDLHHQVIIHYQYKKGFLKLNLWDCIFWSKCLPRSFSFPFGGKKHRSSIFFSWREKNRVPVSQPGLTSAIAMWLSSMSLQMWLAWHSVWFS